MEKKSKYKYTCVPLRAGTDSTAKISEMVELQEWDGYYDESVGIVYKYNGRVLFEPRRDVCLSADSALAIYTLIKDVEAGGLPSGEYFPIAPNRNLKRF